MIDELIKAAKRCYEGYAETNSDQALEKALDFVYERFPTTYEKLAVERNEKR